MREEDLRHLAEGTGELARFLGYDPVRPGTAGGLVPADGPDGLRRLLTGDGLARRQAGGDAVSLEEREESVIMPETSPAEMAKRLQQAEAALARIRSSRAVRWTHAARRAQQRLSGVPLEFAQAAGRSVRRRR
jgi:hypothetical protein